MINDYLDSLDNDLATLKTNVAAKGVTVVPSDNFTTLASKVSQIPSGGTTDIYRVETIQERDALNPSDGDICVLYKSSTEKLPASVEAGTHITIAESVDESLISSGGTIIQWWSQNHNSYIQIMFDDMNSTVTLEIGNMNTGIWYSYDYTLNNGFYTLETTLNPLELDIEDTLSCDPQEYSTAGGLANFVTVTELNFSIYSYDGTSWGYSEIGTDITSDYLFDGSKAYTDNGFITGTLGNIVSSEFTDKNADLYGKLQVYYDGLTPRILTDNDKTINKNIYIIPTKFDGTPLMDTSALTDMTTLFYQCLNLVSIPLLDTSNVTNMENAFQESPKLVYISQLDTSNVTNMHRLCYGCVSLKKIELLDTSSVTNFGEAFANCRLLTSIPLFNTVNVTNMYGILDGCGSLLSIPLFNTSNVTVMTRAFAGCSSITSFPALDTSNVTQAGQMFMGDISLVTIPALNMSKVTTIQSAFGSCGNLTTLGGLINLGQAYSTSVSANYYAYSLYLGYSSQLTHDSLMNVINNLYNIAGKGVQAQQLILGSTNLAKLSSVEIQTATSKGWTVS